MKDEIYEQQISPLVHQIREIALAHNIGYVMYFEIDPFQGHDVSVSSGHIQDAVNPGWVLLKLAAGAQGQWELPDETGH